MRANSKYTVPAMVFLTLLMAVFQTACGGIYQTEGDGVGLLPGPPSEKIHLTKYEPQNPYDQLAPGLLTRTLYRVASGTGYRVEVRDLLVGPGQQTSEVSLPGAGVFELRSGSGVITADGKRQEVRVGSAFALSEGQAFAISNRGEAPITIRVHLFMAE